MGIVAAPSIKGNDDEKAWDVFICHAGEDKDSFVRPLAFELSKTYRVWYDEMTLTVGDSLREKIDEGLRKSRYGIVVLSKAFFVKNWPQAELDGLVSREMAGTRVKVILPVWHGVTRDDVSRYSPMLSGRLAADSKQGTAAVVAKLHAAMRAGSGTASYVHGRPELQQEPPEYFEQRRRLPDSDVFNQILSRPHWRISIFPVEFRKARFRDLDQCKVFVSGSSVRTPSGIAYPQSCPNDLEIGRDYIACDTQASELALSRTERWVLFRSALFVQNKVFNPDARLKNRVHALEILDTATAALEFATRMTQNVSLAPEVAITVGLHGVEGQQLTWPQDIFLDTDAVSQNSWSQNEKIDLSRQLTPSVLSEYRREVAFDLALEIYAQFGWTDPPIDRLRSEQAGRFGA